MQLIHLALVTLLNFSALSSAELCKPPPDNCKWGVPNSIWMASLAADEMAPPSSSRPQPVGTGGLQRPKSVHAASRSLADKQGPSAASMQNALAGAVRVANSARIAKASQKPNSKITAIKHEAIMDQADKLTNQSPRVSGRPSNVDRKQKNQGNRTQTGSVTAAHQNRGNSQYDNNTMSLDFEDEVVAETLYEASQSVNTMRPPPQPHSHAESSQARPAGPMIGAPPTRPTYTMNEAQALKAMLPASTSTVPYLSKTRPRRNPVEQDPENHEIKRLRMEERLSWSAIAQMLNDERIKHGGEPTHTDASVYSRFVRNGPRIAQMQGETLNPKEWMHLKDDKAAKDGGGKKTKWEEQDKIFLVEAFGEVQQGFWEMVALGLEEKSGKKFEAKDCAEMYVRI
ncbi:hypothetical protein FKW77_008944 [Venturia effusa]|uniref:Myb-like domain-containing protein n=1 Tax=Venturia effusa TaxID=50376 RepID=A0A517L644_9PEZI|nr:hypothetical protein FKW77_008944 [Venturia effusa]